MGKILFFTLLCLGSLFAQNTYFGPNQPVPGDPQLVRVQILIQDSPDPAGLTIASVEFNGKKIPLKPRDIFGNRGTAAFQLPPGKYKLKWVVNRNNFVWPRTISHEEIVEVNPRDLWIQITIVGEEATIA